MIPCSNPLIVSDYLEGLSSLSGELEDILEDTEHYVDLMALGEEEDYYIKLSNGKEFWNIPGRLADRLRGKHAEKTVAGVSLGYEDQYNVRFTGKDVVFTVFFML